MTKREDIIELAAALAFAATSLFVAQELQRTIEFVTSTVNTVLYVNDIAAGPQQPSNKSNLLKKPGQSPQL